MEGCYDNEGVCVTFLGRFLCLVVSGLMMMILSLFKYCNVGIL